MAKQGTVSTVIEKDLGGGRRFRKSDGPPISLTTWDLYDRGLLKYPDAEGFTRQLMVSLDKDGLLRIELPDGNYIGLTSRNLGFRDQKSGTKEWKTFATVLDGRPFKRSTEAQQAMWKHINRKLRDALNLYLRAYAVFPTWFKFYEKTDGKQNYTFKFKIALPHREESRSEKRMMGWSKEKLENKVKGYLARREENPDDRFASLNLETAIIVCKRKGYSKLSKWIEEEITPDQTDERLDLDDPSIHVTGSLK